MERLPYCGSDNPEPEHAHGGAFGQWCLPDNQFWFVLAHMRHYLEYRSSVGAVNCDVCFTAEANRACKVSAKPKADIGAPYGHTVFPERIPLHLGA
jgi:hypothetical protein